MVAAVGHESDVSIVILWLTLRASPSAAAELATPDREALLAHMRNARQAASGEAFASPSSSSASACATFAAAIDLAPPWAISATPLMFEGHP